MSRLKGQYDVVIIERELFPTLYSDDWFKPIFKNHYRRVIIDEIHEFGVKGGIELTEIEKAL